jgi:hypothetical protein
MAKGSGGAGRGTGRAPTAGEWDRGVRAARDLGGQVPQSAVNQADRILASEAPKAAPSGNTITRKELAALEKSGRAVTIYKKKGIAVVDGFRRYKLSR